LISLLIEIAVTGVGCSNKRVCILVPNEGLNARDPAGVKIIFLILFLIASISVAKITLPEIG